MTNSEFRASFEVRTKDFAVRVFKFLDALPKKISSQVIAYQLAKSASSVGANYREANRAESRIDFGHKLQIAMKEASESAYWFEVLAGLYPMHRTIKTLSDEVVELRNLFQSICSSTRRKQSNNFKSSNQTIQPR